MNIVNLRKRENEEMEAEKYCFACGTKRNETR